ncbi:MAG: stage V sporulation protein SpoVM [Ruminococcaceae bacterium]|nr:stage V sporulation protein SpoVM [Oscillospiraceae bacterium]
MGAENKVYGGIFMKVLIVKSPRFLGGFLRMIFGIKRHQD